jgi:hypothetical protein
LSIWYTAPPSVLVAMAIDNVLLVSDKPSTPSVFVLPMATSSKALIGTVKVAWVPGLAPLILKPGVSAWYCAPVSSVKMIEKFV